MGFEGFSSSKWPALVRQRSKSVPDNKASEENNSVQSTEATNGSKLDTEPTNGRTDIKKKASSNAETQLRQEIQMLEKRLQDQLSVRYALENALGYRSSSHIIADASAIPKPTAELIKDISVLEVEVEHLEQYLLSLYRKAFDSLSPHEGSKTALSKPEAEYQALPNENGPSEEKLLDSNIQRSHSKHTAEAMGKALRACHSQLLSMIQYAPNTKRKTSDVKSVVGDSKGVPCSPVNHGTNTFDSRPSGKKESLPSMVSADDNTPNTKEKMIDVKSDSKGVPCSDAYKPTSPENHGTNTTPSEAPSVKKQTLQPIHSMANTPNTKKKSSFVKSVLGSSPLARSRSRNATKAN